MVWDIKSDNMNRKSIRFRLTLWYSLAFFVSTAVIFAVFFYITKQTILSQTDRSIITHAETLIKIVDDEQPSMAQGVFNQGIISQQFMEMPGMLVLVTDKSGKISGSSQIGADENAILIDLIEKSANIIKPTFVERRIGTTTLRIGVFPIMQNGQPNGLVFMGDPVDAIYDSFHSLLLTLAAVYFIIAIPAILGSYVLAKSALLPIHKISSDLRSITSQDLYRHVAVPNTDDEVSELAVTFNELLERLHESFKRERQFIGDVAHELKTPVATLKGEIELALSRKRTNGEYQKAFGETLIDVNRLSTTIRNILDLAWIGADKAITNNQQTDLTAVLTELSDIAVKLAAQKHITVKSHIAKGVLVAGSEDKLSRAILNVLHNAVKYTPVNETISVSLRKTNNGAMIEVVDSGTGISEKDLPHIFDRFYRGSKTAKTLGSGLGLAIAQGIIESYGGTVSVMSKVSRGTHVTIMLPLATKA